MGLKSHFPMFPVLVHLGFYNKIPQIGCLQTTEIYFSQLWRLGSPRSRCWQIDSVSGEGPLPDSQTAVFLLCPT